ncbi:cytochrome c6, chloroplastic [Oryza brachyantha]|uniref:cytochrome c6, chloroplastic n=1 Tax=Oryza brachyantha TaxID=4533 RepID=UPI001ADB17FF|nr:cytochrome c6, chloroplastic [Oryza brachyantha]
MHRLPLASRPPRPHRTAAAQRAAQRTTACSGSLTQATPAVRRPPSFAPLAFAASAAAAAGRAATPLFAAAALLLAAAAASPGFPAATPPAFAQSEGAALFRKACIGCHDMGGNILQPGATLFMKDLERNGVATEDELYNITYYGKGRMPGFGEKCTPRGQCTFGPRLAEDDIKLLAAFVKSQAENGWPKIDRDGD